MHQVNENVHSNFKHSNFKLSAELLTAHSSSQHHATALPRLRNVNFLRLSLNGLITSLAALSLLTLGWKKTHACRILMRTLAKVFNQHRVLEIRESSLWPKTKAQDVARLAGDRQAVRAASHQETRANSPLFPPLST